MNRGQEIINSKINDAEVKGKVEIPYDFKSINVHIGIPMADLACGAVVNIKKKCDIIPQYRSLPEKLGGMLCGFYFNPVVKKQNEILKNLKEVALEHERLAEEKNRLINEINDLQAEIIKRRG